MNTCYIYLRVSSEEQVNGFSLDNQERSCTEYAKHQGFTIKDVFREEGYSARNTNRPQLQRMLESIDTNPVNAIVCLKIDRMCRNIADFSKLRKDFKKKSITLLSVNEGDVSDGLIGNIFASVAEWESEVNGKRTGDGMRQKFRQGYYPGKAPCGYQNVIKDDKKIIVPDPVTAPLVVEIFEKYGTGQYSMLELCELMYEKGLRAKTGKMLRVQTVCELLKYPFYYGFMEWGGMQGMGKHEPLIKKTLFDQCQYVASKHRYFLLRKTKRFFLLRGFLYCPVHERRMTADLRQKINSKHRQSISYYRCPNSRGCKASYIETEKLEKIVANQLKKYEFSSDFIELIRQKAKEHLENSRGSIKSQQTALINQRNGTEQKRNNLEDLVVAGTIDREVFKRQHASLQEQIAQIDNRLRDLDGQRHVDFKLIDEVLALSRNIYQTYMDAPDFLKRHYLRIFFEKIYIQDKKIVKLVETPIFKTLREENKVLIKNRLGG